MLTHLPPAHFRGTWGFRFAALNPHPRVLQSQMMSGSRRDSLVPEGFVRARRDSLLAEAFAGGRRESLLPVRRDSYIPPELFLGRRVSLCPDTLNRRLSAATAGLRPTSGAASPAEDNTPSGSYSSFDAVVRDRILADKKTEVNLIGEPVVTFQKKGDHAGIELDAKDTLAELRVGDEAPVLERVRYSFFLLMDHSGNVQHLPSPFLMQ